MDLINMILDRGISLGATDVHLAPGVSPVYRVERSLRYDESKLPLSQETLNDILDFFYTINDTIEADFKEHKQIDFAYTYQEYRFRINVSLTKGCPTFSIRLIPNGEISLDNSGLKEIINKMRKIHSGLVLVTGKVNSGKSTTLNAYLQQVNKELNKKIVTIEDPIEYIHKPDKSVIIQKEVGIESDVNSYHDALVNILREDVDIAVLGEIRDRKTMDVAIELAESGGLVMGTLHTRSCGETVDRIINMYEPSDQMAIKNTLSSVLKMVVSQKLVVGKNGGLVLIPEIMVVSNTIEAQIRQEKFNISEIEDTIHTSRLNGCKSYEASLAELYLDDKITIATMKEVIDPEKMINVKTLIVNAGGTIVD